MVAPHDFSVTVTTLGTEFLTSSERQFYALLLRENRTNGKTGLSGQELK